MKLKFLPTLDRSAHDENSNDTEPTPDAFSHWDDEPQYEITNRDKVITSFIAGALAGSLAKTAIAPLDRTKINFQIHNEQFSFPKAIKFLVNSYKEHGLFSWWRGNTATMARVVPFAACQYAAHEHWKIILKVDTNERRKKHYFKTFLAGSLAGCTASALTYPLDVARARMAVSRPERYRNIIEVFREIWNKEGPRHLYRGFSPTMLGVIPYAGASFFTYETLKRLRAEQTGSTELHPIERLMFGAVGGLFGQSCSYPLDIVRRRMQTAPLTGQNYTSVLGTLITVYKNEGLIGGLYKGLSMNWIKGPIAVGISFMTFDISSQAMQKALASRFWTRWRSV
ncbi:dephosphocoenzyme A carrier isoform X1 [Dermacentor variabilis]|uniref:dephosphocoenzyme A carrier isoform X1 n=1 Tax=Dermacentor variabilis TaxID=34621 RepID=UPI003F5B45F5